MSLFVGLDGDCLLYLRGAHRAAGNQAAAGRSTFPHDFSLSPWASSRSIFFLYISAATGATAEIDLGDVGVHPHAAALLFLTFETLLVALLLDAGAGPRPRLLVEVVAWWEKICVVSFSVGPKSHAGKAVSVSYSRIVHTPGKPVPNALAGPAARARSRPLPKAISPSLRPARITRRHRIGFRYSALCCPAREHSTMIDCIKVRMLFWGMWLRRGM